MEAEGNRRIASMSPAVDAGSDQSMRVFFALLERCEAVVTGDTLALHASLALGRKTVALFGPTSAREIDMYGLGVRLAADMDCLCCYRGACDRSPNCMESIGAERVFRATERLLDGAFGRLRDVKVAPDGAVLLLTDEDDGQLLRLYRAPSSQ